MRPLAGAFAGIVMVARFSRQKDHATLLRAIALLRGRGLRPPVVLAGGGKRVHRDAAQALANELGLSGQVNFMGVCSDVPALLMDHQIAVLSTHHEGMPLALLEGMAAGCAVVGSDVQGVREVIHHGIDGMLVAAGDPARLALVLEALLRNRAKASALAARARESAIRQSGLDLMNRRYESLCLEPRKAPSGWLGLAICRPPARPASFRRRICQSRWACPGCQRSNRGTRRASTRKARG